MSASSTKSQGFGEQRLGFGREAGDQVGADGDAGPQARARAMTASASAREMPALHALQDQVVAGLQRQMQMRHQPRLLGDQPPQIVVDRGGIERGQPQPRQFRHQRQQAADHLAEAGAPGRSRP